jgi:phospholipid/cholesterol/gamma-HCH transport system permease protein
MNIIISFLQKIGQVTIITGSLLKDLFQGKISFKETIFQAFNIGNRSFFFYSVTMAFLGAILITMACNEAKKMIADLSMIGPIYLETLINIFAPTCGSVIIATRVSTGIAAELATMKVTEQTDALRLCGGDPLSYLVAPRVLAGAVISPLLAIYGVALSFFVGGMVAHANFGIGYESYFSLRFVKGHSVISGLYKAHVHGVTMTAIACYFGLKAHGGSIGVGRATTKAVIYAILLILVLDFVISGVSFWIR